MITDLREGDVVTVEHYDYPDATITGPLTRDEHGVWGLAGLSPLRSDGTCRSWVKSLTVVSRAPRPLYVNHPRTELSCGDVFQPEHSQWPLWVAGHDRIAEHKAAESCRWIGRGSLPDRLRLLVDGETGQVVQ